MAEQHQIASLLVRLMSISFEEQLRKVVRIPSYFFLFLDFLLLYFCSHPYMVFWLSALEVADVLKNAKKLTRREISYLL